MGMLDGKTALVTGAGRGIGRGIAIALAKAGAKVVNDLGASLSGEGGDPRPAAQVVRTWGRIDVLVHVAGILRDRMIFNMTEAEWDAVIAVHLDGMFNVVRAASASMREQKGG